MPSKNHAILQGRITGLFYRDYEDKFVIMPEVSLNTEKPMVPDVAIYPSSVQFIPALDEVKMEEKPIGVIEILSPTQSLSELIEKSIRYFESGVKSYWLVLPALQNIYVFHAPGEYQMFTHKESLKDKTLDIELDLSEVFK